MGVPHLVLLISSEAVQVLHLEDNTWILHGREGQASQYHGTAVHVRKVQSFTHLVMRKHILITSSTLITLITSSVLTTLITSFTLASSPAPLYPHHQFHSILITSSTLTSSPVPLSPHHQFHSHYPH